jgi:adenylate cyclase
LKILVVDDIKMNRVMVEEMLTLDGYEVFTANNGMEALQMLREQHIQIVLSDWMMPEMDGVALAKRIREEFPENYIYIVILTARSEHRDMIVGLESGADDYVSRPFSPPELMARVSIGRRLIELENSLKAQTLDIARSKQEWEATTDSISQMICLIDAENRVLRINKTVERWGLARAEEAVGEKVTDLLATIYTDFAEQYRAEWEKASASLRDGLEYEFEGHDDRLGHYFMTQFEPINPFGEADGNNPSFAAVNIQDITERKKLEIELQAAKRQLEREHAKSENLLLNMLPRKVAENLKNGEETVADYYDNVTVMFADLVGFTRLTASISPDDLMDLLNGVFSAFDMLAERHRVEKIKTIGDAYMVASGLPEPASDHAERSARMALAMQEAIKQVNAVYGYDLTLRVGIHSGSALAGVIGMKKLVYDLWGDTVNIASRMETHGVPGRIQVSEATYELLKDTYEFEPRGTLALKNMGQAQAYLLIDPNKQQV